MNEFNDEDENMRSPLRISPLIRPTIPLPSQFGISEVMERLDGETDDQFNFRMQYLSYVNYFREVNQEENWVNNYVRLNDIRNEVEHYLNLLQQVTNNQRRGNLTRQETLPLERQQNEFQTPQRENSRRRPQNFLTPVQQFTPNYRRRQQNFTTPNQIFESRVTPLEAEMFPVEREISTQRTIQPFESQELFQLRIQYLNALQQFQEFLINQNVRTDSFINEAESDSRRQYVNETLQRYNNLRNQM